MSKELTPTEIYDRIEEAFTTLLLLPDTHRQRVVKSLWPEPMPDRQELWNNYARHEVVMPRSVPSSRAITRMEEVIYQWLPLFIKTLDTAKDKRDHHRVIAMRALGKPWRQIGYSVGKSHTHCKRMMEDAVLTIYLRL